MSTEMPTPIRDTVERSRRNQRLDQSETPKSNGRNTDPFGDNDSEYQLEDFSKITTENITNTLQLAIFANAFYFLLSLSGLDNS